MKIHFAVFEFLKKQALEQCSENYVSLVKGYAETIQELLPTFELPIQKVTNRGRRELSVELTPEALRGEYDYETFTEMVTKDMGKEIL